MEAAAEAAAPRQRHLVTLRHGGATCHVLGVCHLSAESAAEARRAVEELCPDVVCLELCDEREVMLADISTGPAFVLQPLCADTFWSQWRVLIDPVFWLVHLQLLGLEALLGTRVGAEQLAAADAAVKSGAMVVLADRRQSTTLARTLGAIASPGGISDLLRGLRQGDVSLPAVARDVAELEMTILSRSLGEEEFLHAAALARRIVAAVLDAPQGPSFGRAGAPIQEERDRLLAHALWHASCTAPPGGCALGILGAAHLPGAALHFPTFAARGCTESRCGVVDEMHELETVPTLPLCFAAAGLLTLSCAGVGGRWLLVRRLRRTRGPVFARRFNRASIAAAAGLACFGAYRFTWQYEAVRKLQQHRLAIDRRSAAIEKVVPGVVVE